MSLLCSALLNCDALPLSVYACCALAVPMLCSAMTKLWFTLSTLERQYDNWILTRKFIELNQACPCCAVLRCAPAVPMLCSALTKLCFILLSSIVLMLCS